MPLAVTCPCGTKLRVPDPTPPAVRCPKCQQALVLTAPAAAPPPAPAAPAAPSRPAAPPPPPPRPAPSATTKAPPPPPPAPPARAPAPPRPQAGGKDVWLYVTDPEVLARAEEDGGRGLTLTTFGPDDDPLADADVRDADEVRDYLARNEYIVWLGRPSPKARARHVWVAYLLGSSFVLVGLLLALAAFVLAIDLFALRLVLAGIGVIFAGMGGVVLILLARGWSVGKGPGDSLYLLTNRRVIVWRGRDAVRSFTGPQVMNMSRATDDEDEDLGSVLFSHGMDGNPAGAGFVDIEQVSEVEELIRHCLIDRVLEKSSEAAGPAIPAAPARGGANPFRKSDGKAPPKPEDGPRHVELWAGHAEARDRQRPIDVAEARKRNDRTLEGANVTDAVADAVCDQLTPGELILWIGRPSPGVLFKRAWVPAGMLLGGIFFSIILCVVVSFSMPEAFGGGTLIATGLVFLALTALGLGFPFYRRWVAGRALYVLTNRSARVWWPNWMGKPEMEEYSPRDLAGVHTVGRDVIFRTETTVYRSKQGPDRAFVKRFGFLAVEEPARVERMIREALVDPFLEQAYE